LEQWQSAAATPLWLNPKTPQSPIRLAGKISPPVIQPNAFPGKRRAAFPREGLSQSGVAGIPLSTALGCSKKSSFHQPPDSFWIGGVLVWGPPLQHGTGDSAGTGARACRRVRTLFSSPKKNFEKQSCSKQRRVRCLRDDIAQIPRTL
jgi:hypothetical protein